MQGKRRPIKLLLPVLAFLSCYDVAAKKISTSSGSRNTIQQKLFQRNTPEGLWGDASASAEEEEDWGGRRDNAAQSSRATPGRHGRDTDLDMPTASAAHSQVFACDEHAVSVHEGRLPCGMQNNPWFITMASY